MAVTLVEAAKYSKDPLQQGVIEMFIQEGKVLDQLPLKEIEGNSLKYNKEGKLPGVEFRAVNAAYAESTGTINQDFEGLVILGGDADVDTFLAKTGGTLSDIRAEQDKMKVKAASYKFQDAFINGDVAVDPNSFDGLKKRLVGGQVIDAAANGLPIIGASSADRHAFFDKLDELFAAVKGGPPDVLYMNDSVAAWLASAARREGFWTQERDEFGRKVNMYNGVPFVDLGENLLGNPIIPQTEVMGEANDTSSIYAVRFGNDEADQAVTGIQNGGIDVRDLGELQSKPAYRTRIEFFCGLAVFGRGAARLRGVRRG